MQKTPPAYRRGGPVWPPAIGRCHVAQTCLPPRRPTPRALPRPPGRPHRAAPTNRRLGPLLSLGGFAGVVSRFSVVGRAVSRRGAELLCAALLLLMAVNFLTVLAQKSITTDEGV